MIGQLFALTTLAQDKELHYPLDRTQGGPQSWSGHFGEEPAGIQIPDCPVP